MLYFRNYIKNIITNIYLNLRTNKIKLRNKHKCVG